MFPFLYGYFLLVHVLLFLAVGHVFDVVSAAVVLEIVVLFHLGVMVGLRQAASGEWNNLVVYRVRTWMVLAGFGAFFLLRLQKIGSFVDAALSGNTQGYLLQNAIDRYAGVETTTLDNVGTFVFLGISGLVGAWFGSSEGRTGRLAMAVTYSLLIFVQSLDLSRASTVLGIMMLFCFLLFNKRADLYRHGLSWAFRFVAITFITAFGIFAFGQYGRVFAERDAFNITIERANNLFVAGHYAFLTFLNEHGLSADGDGSGMFGAVAKLMGRTFLQGNYDPINTKFGSTNIFLWYRGAIEDIGPLFGIYDFLCGYSTIALANRNPNRLETLACMFGIQLIIFPFYSPLYFTVFFVPFVCLVMFLPRVSLARVREAAGDDGQEPALPARPPLDPTSQ